MGLETPHNDLIEAHLRIVPKIAGKIAWKRFPKSFGIWAKEARANIDRVGLVYELTAMGNLGLFIAAKRFNPNSKTAFSTYAKFLDQEVYPTLPR